MELNEVQGQIVASNNPRIMVVAGPGSGKTRVMVERISRLMASSLDTLERFMVSVCD